MTVERQSYGWNVELFSDCYNLIKLEENVIPDSVKSIKYDLHNILVTPPKSERSKNEVINESKPVKFSDGEEFKLNKPFIEKTILLSSELDLDEIATAELLYFATTIEYKMGTNLEDSAKHAFFSRYIYILNILGYLVSSKKLHVVVGSDYNTFIQNLMKSFERLYAIATKIDEVIEKQKVVGDLNNLAFVNSVHYLKFQILSCHELMGQIYYGLVENYFEEFSSYKTFNEVVDHVSSNLLDDDLMTVHFLPGLLKIVSNLEQLPDSVVDEYYRQITQILIQDYKKVLTDDYVDMGASQLKSFQVVIYLVFFTNFISWCKISDKRTEKYDFRGDILKYIEWLINYGVMEKLLCFTADSSHVYQDSLAWNDVYDFRSLLQKTHPRLTLRKLTYSNSAEVTAFLKMRPELSNIEKLIDMSDFTLSRDFNDELLAPFFHDFFCKFVTNAAIILTSLKDNEEDFLLSSINKKKIESSGGNDDLSSEERQSKDNLKGEEDRGLNLEEISSRSDLERFYLAFVYTYQNRPQLSSLLWSDEDLNNNITGFIMWGLNNNTSPLITATFCLLLGSILSPDNDSSLRMWEILINNNSLKKNDYSKISIDSIIESLVYYIDALNENFKQDVNEQINQQQKIQESLFSSSLGVQDTVGPNSSPIVIELAEDSIVFISGFIQLISSISRNLSQSHERSREVRIIIFNRFSAIITDFLKFDNLITATKGFSSSLSSSSPNRNKSDQPPIFINEENRVVLTNLIMTLLNSFVSDDETLVLRFKVWDVVDRWICQKMFEGSSNEAQQESDSNNGNNLFFNQSNNKTPKQMINRRIKINQGFLETFVHFSQVMNYVKLLKALLKPLNSKNQAFTKYKLLYPHDLGAGYRDSQIGIWPYMEFLLLNLFSKADQLPNKSDKHELKLSIIEIIDNSLGEIDWVFINDIAPKIMKDFSNVNDIIADSQSAPISYQTFIKLHHSLAILNYMFDEKAYTSLFNIIGTSIEILNTSNQSTYLVEVTLRVMQKILQLQDTFINRLLTVIRTNDFNNLENMGPTGFGTNMSLALTLPKNIYDNIYYPRNIGTNGVSNFYEILLFSLPSVANLCLFVGCSNESIAKLSIGLLNQISKSSLFVSKVESEKDDKLLSKNRLLTILESIDESHKIKFAFIEQFENVNGNLDVKYEILRFLIENLNSSNGREPVATHFLLGFNIRGGNLHLDPTEKSNSLLKSLISLLQYSLHSIAEVDFTSGQRVIDAGTSKLSSLILEVIVRLCRDPISSAVTLAYLRGHEKPFEELINYQPRIDLHTVWSYRIFDDDLQSDYNNEFIQDQNSSNSLFSFINHRNLVLQYLSLELHHINLPSKKEYYNNLLLANNEFLDGSPKVLHFIDILNYKFRNFEVQEYQNFESKYNMTEIFDFVHKSTESELNLSLLSKIFKIKCQASNLATKDQKSEFANQIMIEGNRMAELLTKYAVSNDLKSVQLNCLHSWCQLIEILVTDSSSSSENFILEIFQVILPKINDYLETDILFCEELISLSVLLFDYYEKEFSNRENGEEYVIGIQRLLPLFKTCINGILNTNSTPNLRSDFYVLVSRMLGKSLHNEVLLNQLSSILRSTDKKFFDILCNDSIYSEGSTRITSILLLEALIHLSSSCNVNFALDFLIKNNSLLSLIRSITRTDEMLSLCSEASSGIGLDTVLYELMAFKSTLYFLIRVAMTKAGSFQLIQSELFAILKESSFLKIDPDMGLNLNLNDSKDVMNVEVSLLLDAPMSLGDIDGRLKHNGTQISYFEFLIPMFQLISTILVSMGPGYKPSIIQAKDILSHYDKLVQGIVKRDILIEEKHIQLYHEDSVTGANLKELVKLFTLINSLIHYEDKE